MPHNLSKIQYITINYSRLQGLRSVPVGILLGLTGIWVILPAGQDGDLGLPLIMMAFTGLAYFAVDCYYARNFGQVTQTAQERGLEIISALIFGVLAFLSFLLDTRKTVPINFFALVMAAALFFPNFLRYGFYKLQKSPNTAAANALALHPGDLLAGLGLISIGLLPLSGWHWWEAFGFKEAFPALLIVCGLLVTITGVSGHIQFTRSLKGLEEAQRGNTL